MGTWHEGVFHSLSTGRGVLVSVHGGQWDGV